MLRFLLQNVRLKSINAIAITTTLKNSRKITPKTIKEQSFSGKIIKKQSICANHQQTIIIGTNLIGKKVSDTIEMPETYHVVEFTCFYQLPLPSSMSMRLVTSLMVTSLSPETSAQVVQMSLLAPNR